MKTIIFDMDGLMFDTEKLYELAMDYAGEKMGFGKIGYLNMMAIGLNGRDAHKIWKKELGIDYDVEEFKGYVREFRDEYYEKNGVPEKLGLQELISYLKENDYKLGLASSSSIKTVENALKLAKLDGVFEVMMGGDMVEEAKPNPRIYREVCRKLGENPEDCYVLEDSKNGILAAYGAGCKVIMVPDILDADEEVKDKLFKKLESLLEVKDYFEHVE
jgi:HAD superfamily hydrolase (TIGR01509 family)